MINDGGPAFPIKDFDGDIYLGMSSRDYFAAKAMQAILGMQGIQLLIKDHESMNRIARASYGWADAMLKARDEQ